MKEISLHDYAMGRDLQFPEEWKFAEAHALVLLPKVNGFLADCRDELQIIIEPEVASGFRPSAINAKVPGSAKKSLHMLGRAIDLKDPGNNFKLAFQPLINPDHAKLLRRWELFMEHPEWTMGKDRKNGWIHLDIGPRADRPTRTFIPR